MWTVDSVKIGDYFPLLSVALLEGHHRELSCTLLEFKSNFLQTSEIFALLLYPLLSSELVNSDISERKKVTKVNCLDFKIVTYRPYRLVRRPVFYRMQAHKSKGREECHILFLSYLNQCYRSPCLPVLRCCLQCQTLQWQNN